MAGAIKRTVKIGGRSFTVHESVDLAAEFIKAAVDATSDQLRILATVTKEEIQQRLLAGSPGKGVKRVALPAPKELRRGVKPYKHKALSPAYAARKKARNLDGRKLIATGDYVKHIQVVERKKNGVRTYHVFVPKRRHRPSGLALRELARIHEFGTETIPARPHWRPTLRAMRARFRKVRENAKVDAVRRTLNAVSRARKV